MSGPGLRKSPRPPRDYQPRVAATHPNRVTLYLPVEMMEEAARLGRGPSWLARKVWRLAKAKAT